MTSQSVAKAVNRTSVWKDYLELCKPRVVALMILTTIAGMFLAAPGMISWQVLLIGNLGIALAAGSAAVINHVIDRNIDVLMRRTERRPIVQGRITPKQALTFSLVIGVTGITLLAAFVNGLTALLTFITLIGYAIVYTVYLKHATPQNIVIGGLAGAAPPLLGWVAVTGHIGLGGLILLAIIFVWTPPHFWALAIHRFEDYAKAKVPMLPNTHGIRYTKINIIVYTLVLFVVSLLPFFVHMSGVIYLLAAVLMGAWFVYLSIKLYRTDDRQVAMRVFRYSICYLMGLFVAMLLDHYCQTSLLQLLAQV